MQRRERQEEEDYMASLTSEQREATLQRMKEIHFGTLGIPMREGITFTKTGAQYIIGSGRGKPNNGGTLVVVPGEGLWSLRALTRRLMGEEFNETGDVWSLWDHKGESLRSIFEQKGFGTPSRSS